MAYVVGFVVPVPKANKDAYLKQARDAVGLFRGYGVTRMVEAWGDEVPRGETTDFYRAVDATDDEAIVFSWHEYPDAETADRANRQMMEDPAMAALGNLPFDGQRMIFGGFGPVVDDAATGKLGYLDGMVAAVPTANQDRFARQASELTQAFRSEGAVRVMDGWGTYVPEGKVTDFRRAVQAKGDEQVVFSWIEWPSKAIRDAAWERLMNDARMQPDQLPFDGKRLIFGTFVPILDT